MKKRVRKCVIGMIFTLIASIIILLLISNDTKYISKTFTGEGELWSISLSFEGHIKFYNDENGQLNSDSDMKKDVTVLYKGDLNDLADIQAVGVKSQFAGMGIGSTVGFTVRELNLKGSGGTGILTLKNTDVFEVTVHWQDNEYHEESFYVNSTN